MAGVNTFEVLSPGIMSTVQDLGRFGCAGYGVAVSGALDGFAVRVGNLLVGNDENAAVVETTLMGLRIKVLRDTVVAVTGGDLQARKGSEPLPMWRSHVVREGESIVFSGPASGLRSYLAVAGGIQVPAVMGSRSTNLSTGFGGFDGRPLRKGDILSAEAAQRCRAFRRQGLHAGGGSRLRFALAPAGRLGTAGRPLFRRGPANICDGGLHGIA